MLTGRQRLPALLPVVPPTFDGEAFSSWRAPRGALSP
jgi:hypothetical protein